MCWIWLSTVFSEMIRRVATCFIELPRASRRNTSTCRSLRPATPWRERGGAGEHPLSIVGMQAHLFPIALGERAGLAPDARRHAHPPDVVDQPGAAQGKLVAGGQAVVPPGLGGQRRHARRMAEQIG